MCAHVYIYACSGGRGDVSLSGEGWWARAGNHMLRSWPEEDHQNTRLSGEKKNKGSFQASTWPEGNLAEDSPTRGSRPAAGPCNALPGCAAEQRCPLPPRGWYPNGDGDPQLPASALCFNRGCSPAALGWRWECPWQKRQLAGVSWVRGCMEGCYREPLGQHLSHNGHRHPLARPPAPGALHGTARGWTVAL